MTGFGILRFLLSSSVVFIRPLIARSLNSFAGDTEKVHEEEFVSVMDFNLNKRIWYLLYIE